MDGWTGGFVNERTWFSYFSPPLLISSFLVVFFLTGQNAAFHCDGASRRVIPA